MAPLVLLRFTVLGVCVSISLSLSPSLLFPCFSSSSFQLHPSLFLPSSFSVPLFPHICVFIMYFPFSPLSFSTHFLSDTNLLLTQSPQNTDGMNEEEKLEFIQVTLLAL